MKKLVLSLFVMCFTVMFANAQDAPKQAEAKKPLAFEWKTEGLKEIGCDDAQIKQIAKLKVGYSKARKAIQADSTLDASAKKTAIRTALKERNTGLRAALTPEQSKKVDEINAKLKSEAANK